MTNRKTIYKGRVIDVGIETVELPDGNLFAMDIIRTRGGAVVAAIDDDNNYCLIKQFRHAVGGWIWEFPAGIPEPNEDVQITAARELQEETGCEASHWQSLGSIITSPGFCDEKLDLFLARSLTKGISSPENHEFIEIHWMTSNQILNMILDGEIKDAKTIVAFFKAEQSKK